MFKTRLAKFISVKLSLLHLDFISRSTIPVSHFLHCLENKIHHDQQTQKLRRKMRLDIIIQESYDPKSYIIFGLSVQQQY